jgi:hypothetical protein
MVEHLPSKYKALSSNPSTAWGGGGWGGRKRGRGGEKRF